MCQAEKGAESGHREHLGEGHIVADSAKGERHWGKGQDHALGSRALQRLHAVARALRNKRSHCCNCSMEAWTPCQFIYQLADTETGSSSATFDALSLMMPSHLAGDALSLLSYKQQLLRRRTSVLARPISTSPAWFTPLLMPLVWPWPLVRPFCSSWAAAWALRKLAPVRLSERGRARGVRGALGDLLDLLQDHAG